jgi:hypothetical protein
MPRLVQRPAGMPPPSPAPRPALARPWVALAVVGAAILVAIPSSASAGPGSPYAANPAPEIVLADGINGVTAQTTLASLRGRPVLIALWIPICPH